MDTILMRGEVSEVSEEEKVEPAAPSSSDTETVIADAENQIYIDAGRQREEQ